MTESPWLTREQVAAYLGGLNLSTVDKMASDGRLKKHYLGRLVRFHRDEVDAALMGEVK